MRILADEQPPVTHPTVDLGCGNWCTLNYDSVISSAIAILVTVVVAILIFVVLAIAGEVRAGVAVALGLVLGSVNGLVAQRALDSGVSVRLSSLPRLAILTIAAIGGGLLIGVSYAWLVILGVAGAQLVLVVVAARSLLKR